MLKHFKLIIFLVSIAFNLHSQIVNIEGNRFYNDTNKVSGFLKANLFYSETKENVLTLNSSFHLQIKQDSNKLYLLIFDFNKINSGSTIISDYRILHARFNYKINKIITYELFSQILYNNYLEINARTDFGTGLRIKSISNESYKVYNGFLLMKENYFNSNLIYKNCFRYDFYISFNLKIDKLIHLINTTYYQPMVNNISDYRILNEFTIDVKVFKHLSLENSLSNVFQSVSPKDISSKSFLNKVSFIILF